jgi:hypothetical protein
MWQFGLCAYTGDELGVSLGAASPSTVGDTGLTGLGVVDGKSLGEAARPGS